MMDDKIIIKIPDLIKTSRADSVQPLLVLPSFKEKLQICPVTALIDYKHRTQSIRKTEELFVGLSPSVVGLRKF